ncbi:MAG: hypothetical protein HQL95_07100 [Magnetococcales bacterium]|nr:hypothetical protein [Magnetococcales bacterium]
MITPQETDEATTKTLVILDRSALRMVQNKELLWWRRDDFGCYHDEFGTKDTSGTTYRPCMGTECQLFVSLVPCRYAQFETKPE